MQNYLLGFSRTLSVGCGLFFVAFFTWTGCASDQLPEPMVADCEMNTPTYNLEVRPIIDATCAYSTCHLDNPSAVGKYDTYADLVDYLQDDESKFRQRALVIRGGSSASAMPPDYAPEGRPDSLTAAQVLIIECWLDAGYPE